MGDEDGWGVEVVLPEVRKSQRRERNVRPMPEMRSKRAYVEPALRDARTAQREADKGVYVFVVRRK